MSVLFENFDTIFGTKENIKALRNKIFVLAIEGKLVPQDSSDEPALELVRKIQLEKSKLINDGEIKKQNNFIPVNKHEQFFDIPSNWVWVRLGELADFIDYRGKTPEKTDTGIPLITAKNIKYGYINEHPKEYISDLDYEGWMTRGIPGYGNLVITTEAPLANVARLQISGKYALAQRAIALKTHINDIDSFLLIALMSEQIRNSIFNKATGTTVLGIKASELKEIPIPLPPLSEQNRISNKIASLISEIDKLEAALEKKERLMELLPRAVVDAIGNCQTENELKLQLEFLIENNETIFQTPESMQELRNIIFDLAIRGAIVAQSLDEEPAKVLLDKIVSAKITPEKKGQGNMSPFSIDNEPFLVPSNWVWTKLGVVTTYGNNKQIQSNDITNDSWVLELEDIEKNTSKLLNICTNKTRQAKSNKNMFDKGDVLYGKLRPYLKKAIIAPDNGVCTTEIVPIKGLNGVNNGYILIYLKSQFADNLINSLTYGMSMPRLGTQDGQALPFPLPPINEQSRIVDRVNVLMSIIDELEMKIRKRIEVVEKMATAV